MSAADLLQRLTAAGLALQPDGPRVIVRPRSLLTDADREAIRAHKGALLALLSAASLHEPAETETRTCSACARSTRYRTCTDPVAAGLAPVWRIEWPPADHAATCPAWAPRP